MADHVGDKLGLQHALRIVSVVGIAPGGMDGQSLGRS